MKQGDGEEPPPNDVQRVNHVRRAVGDDQVHHKQKAAGGADDQRTRIGLNSLSVMLGVRYRLVAKDIALLEKDLPASHRLQSPCHTPPMAVP
jgi:hypothetical protein